MQELYGNTMIIILVLINFSIASISSSSISSTSM